MDKHLSPSSGKGRSSPDSRTHESSQKAISSSGNISELSDKIESSLCVSETPERESEEEKAKKHSNISQELSFCQSMPNEKSEEARLKKTGHINYKSWPGKYEIPNSKETDEYKSSYASKQDINTKSDGIRQPPFSSPGNAKYRAPNSHAKTQYFQSMVDAQYLPRYPPNIHMQEIDRHRYRSQTGAHAKDQNSANRNRSFLPNHLATQFQNLENSTNTSELFLPAHISTPLKFPQSKTKTAAQPIVHLPHNRNSTNYFNKMPPIRTNATPIQNVQHSSNHPNSIIRTNAVPMSYAKRPSYQNKKPPIGTNEKANKHAQSLNVSGGICNLLSIIENKSDLIPNNPNQDSKFPTIKTQNSASKEKDSLNTVNSNIYQSNALKRFKNLAKKAHYSKKNMLTVESPENLNPDGKLCMRELHWPPFQFPTALGSDAIEQAVIPNQLVPSMRVSNESLPQGKYHAPLVAKQAFPLLEMQDNAASHAYNSTQPSFQAQVTKSSGEKYQRFISAPQYQDPNQPMYQCGTPYQPSLQNLTTETRYQYPNQPTYQHGMQHQPAWQNLTAVPQYPDTNQSMYQHGAQHQPAWQNLTAVPQYPDTNRSMYQYGAQYEPAWQNLTAVPQYQGTNQPMYQCVTNQPPAFQSLTTDSQYQDPNYQMYQYGKQMPLQSSWPPGASWYYPIPNESIPPPQDNSYRTQTTATSITSDNTIQNPILPPRIGNPNYLFTGYPNISNVKPSVENPISICMNHYASMPYPTVESVSQNWMDYTSQDVNYYQGHVSGHNPEIIDANTYPVWSASTYDPFEKTHINERDRAS